LLDCSYYLSSLSTTSRTPTPGGPVAGGAPGTSGPHDVTKGHRLKDPSVKVTHGDGTPVHQDPVPEIESSTAVDAVVSSVMGKATVGGSASLAGRMVRWSSFFNALDGDTTATAGADDDDADELEVILRHPILRAPGDASLSEAMGMAHWALNQAHDVLR
jgi:hypothetical protein